MSKYEALKKAIEKAGSQTALAKICGVSQNAVWKWLNQTKELPIEYCRKVELATRVPAHELQPFHFSPPHPTNISGEYLDEYGNPQPILDKQLVTNEVAA